MLKIGIAGARGLSTLLGFQAIDGVEVTAVCDLDGALLKEVGAAYHIPHTYRIFDDILASDIDAVVIATPMQCHVPQAIAALDAGKHVFSEVTAGVTLDELWWLIESVERSGKVYMFAENYCYSPENQLIRTMVRQGLFGEIYYGEGEYLHEIGGLLHQASAKPELHASAPEKAQSAFTWRKYWQLGKHGTFYPTHSVGPLMQWFEGDRIASIATFSSGKHVAPELRQEDTTVTLCQLESGKLLRIRVDCLSKRPHNMAYYQLQGTKGVVEAPRGLGDQYKLWLTDFDKDTESARWRPLSDFNHLLPERYRSATEAQKGAGHGGGDFFIVQDFVDAVLGKKAPDIDVYQACEWTAVALLSELSVTNCGRVMEMPRFRKNMPLSEQFLKL